MMKIRYPEFSSLINALIQYDVRHLLEVLHSQNCEQSGAAVVCDHQYIMLDFHFQRETS